MIYSAGILEKSGGFESVLNVMQPGFI